jgi:hypothetical protein
MAGFQPDQKLIDQIIENAVLACAKKFFSGDSQLVLASISKERSDVYYFLANHLATQLGEYLGQVDPAIEGVFLYEPEYLATSIKKSSILQPVKQIAVNLVVWLHQKSTISDKLKASLIDGFRNSKNRLSIKENNQPGITLDIQIVEDYQVAENLGLGMLVNHLFLRSVPVWKRSEPANAINRNEGVNSQSLFSFFDTEIAPDSMLFEQAIAIERLEEKEGAFLQHRLREIKVTLIRRLISDQLAYIRIAKEWFNISDLHEIYERRIGSGKIGGKSAGMLLAMRIVQQVAEKSLRDNIHVPESYFLGSDLSYIFMSMNGLMHWYTQKYKSEEEIWSEYTQIQQDFLTGEFPPEVVEEFRSLLRKIGKKPIVVRSSSQLEDNFGTSFAGKYETHFCPNQGSDSENLKALTQAIARVYASVFNPDALLYRRSKGLQDYDERMAVLIQEVQGEQFGNYFLPFAAGVAFSRNLYRWSPQIRREAGFARLVWGLGTRAVQRVGNDYPRLVALSHPMLQPDDSIESVRHYSQQYVDFIDLKENSFKTLPIAEVLNPRYFILRLMAQIVEEDSISTPRSRIMEDDVPNLAITFSELLKRTDFASSLSKTLSILEERYQIPVDLEFTISISDPNALKPSVSLTLLQCRPQSHFQASSMVYLPGDIPHEDLIFSTNFMVPQGYLPGVRYVLYVTPEGYYSLPTAAERNRVARIISIINGKMGEKSYICLGPGRWGTTNYDLGVFVAYSDIHRAGALIEMSGKGVGLAPEPSLGTHFFQDLMEAEIYPIAINLDEPTSMFNKDFFYNTPNCLQNWTEIDENMQKCIRLIDVSAYRPDSHIDIVMDDEKGKAVAFLVPNTYL